MDKDVSQREPLCNIGGNPNYYTIIEKSIEPLFKTDKLEIGLPFDSAIPCLDI